MNRQNKGGGGVALYVHKDVKYERIELLTTAVDNVMECITIEISLENAKNKTILISCIYRAPDSNVDCFRDWVEEVYSKKSHKTVFICGDININLLNPNEHKGTEEFINSMYSMIFFSNYN